MAVCCVSENLKVVVEPSFKATDTPAWIYVSLLLILYTRSAVAPDAEAKVD